MEFSGGWTVEYRRLLTLIYFQVNTIIKIRLDLNSIYIELGQDEVVNSTDPPGDDYEKDYEEPDFEEEYGEPDYEEPDYESDYDEPDGVLIINSWVKGKKMKGKTEWTSILAKY